MQPSNTIEKIELAELPKLINKRKMNYIRKHHMLTIENALLHRGNLKLVKRKLCTGKHEIYELRDREANTITNINRTVEVGQ